MTTTFESRLAPYRVRQHRSTAINLNDLCAVSNERARYLQELAKVAARDVEEAQTIEEGWEAVGRLGRAVDALQRV